MSRFINVTLLILGAALVLLFVFIWRAGELRSRQWYEKHKADERAALRPPPKPPNCPDLPFLTRLRLADGSVSDVRIFRFERTVYFVPTTWLGLKSDNHGELGGMDSYDLGRIDPDLHAIECPGIEHQITDGGLYLSRHMGIGFVPSVADGDDRTSGPMVNASYFFAQKIRPNNERLRRWFQEDGLIDSMGHQTLDAYIKVAPDVGLRLTWHPKTMTRDDWSAQYLRYSSGPLFPDVA